MSISLFRICVNYLASIIAAIAIIWSNLIIYGIEQAKGQLTIVNNSIPFQELLSDRSSPISTKQKIKLIREIKGFAVDSLGLSNSSSYSSIFLDKKDSILLTITACAPLSFQPKEWSFPILGEVPYKGYFNPNKAQRELQQLKEQGYDIQAYYPAAWSTLGWLNDPILPGMLNYSDGRLAELIIHEMCHSTIFVKSDIKFNENLANFIGKQGALQFLIDKYGIHSQHYQKYLNKLADDNTFSNYMNSGFIQLDSLYRSNQPKELLLSEKERIINRIVSEVDSLQLYNKQGFKNYAQQAVTEKNAFFMSFQRYNAEYFNFKDKLSTEYNGNLKSYIDQLKLLYQ